MRILKIAGLSVLSIVIIGIVSLTSYIQYRNWKRNQKGDNFIELEAIFMQYACGEDNDDMQVKSVNDSQFHFILGKDIDPELEGKVSSYLKEYFYENESDTFGMTYKLAGTLSKYPESGCDSQAPIFWASSIEKLDGTEKETFANKTYE